MVLLVVDVVVEVKVVVVVVVVEVVVGQVFRTCCPHVHKVEGNSVKKN